MNTLFCNNNQIQSLNLDNNTGLVTFNGSNNNLNYLSVKNGNNSALTGTLNYYGMPKRFMAFNNPNLSCIYVDDANYCNANWPGKDAIANYGATLAECTVLSTNEFAVNAKVKLYPNPSNDIIHIETVDNLDKVEIYNLLGQLVLESKINEINISKLSSGNYIVKISTDEKVETVKFVKN